jgi:hypothetical protein
MKESTAKGLIAEYLNCGRLFNRITELSDEIEDIETRGAVRRAAADAQGHLYEGLVHPIVKQYPSLAPPGDDTDAESQPE